MRCWGSSPELLPFGKALLQENLLCCLCDIPHSRERNLLCVSYFIAFPSRLEYFSWKGPAMIRCLILFRANQKFRVLSKHWQGWSFEPLSGKPFPVFNHPLSKEVLPSVKAEPALTRLGTIPTRPVTGGSCKEQWGHSSSSFSPNWTKLHQICCPPLDIFEYLNTLPVITQEAEEIREYKWAWAEVTACQIPRQGSSGPNVSVTIKQTENKCLFCEIEMCKSPWKRYRTASMVGTPVTVETGPFNRPYFHLLRVLFQSSILSAWKINSIVSINKKSS